MSVPKQSIDTTEKSHVIIPQYETEKPTDHNLKEMQSQLRLGDNYDY